ncbi:MAG: class I SAM-dependent methyltransferase [Candidatus Magasanikbacteria bacterium]|nr:class I SAM-dependent methyltransferase [Candidatus Magasanikbacteria bacterium]
MNTHESHNRAFFGRWAKKYDRLRSRLFFEPLYRKIISLLKQVEVQNFEPLLLGTGTTMLDVACGTAEVLYRLAHEFPATQFTGLDLTPEMIATARSKTNKLTNLTFREGNASSLPFPDQTFNIILCSEAFHHFSEPGNTLREIHRVLKPGGLFLLADIAFNNRVLKYLVTKIIKPLEYAHAYYSRDELAQFLLNAGFSIIQIKTYWWNNFVLGKK